MSAESSIDRTRPGFLAALRHGVLASALPSRKRWSPAIAFGVLADVCVVALLGLSMWLIVRAGEQPPILHLTFAIVGVRAFAIGRAAFRYAERLASHDAVFRQLATVRTDTFERLVPLTPGSLDERSRGEVLTRLVDDVDELQNLPLRVVQPMITSGIVVALSVVVVAILSPASGLILLLSVLAGGALAVFASNRVAARSEERLAGYRAELAVEVSELLASADVLRAFGALPAKRERVRLADERLRDAQRRAVSGEGLAAGVLALFSGIATLAVLWLMAAWGGPAVSGLSAPLTAALIVVPAAVFEVFAATPVALQAMRRVRASAERVDEIARPDRPAEIPDESAGSDDWAPVAGEALVELTGLSVRRVGAEHDTVSGIDLRVAAGDTVVIAGESGVGKSTLALALVRFLEYSGSYRLSGVEANTLTGRAVRRVVGLCEQSPQLFDSDLRQNLLFARDTATEAELLDVLERVGLSAWAAERAGLDTRVGEEGALVSGGQAQRIALARALLADVPVLIFDEPTAHVDPERAQALLEDLLGAVPADRAVIVISHTPVPQELVRQQLTLTRTALRPA